MLITGGAGFIGSNYVHYVVETHPEYEVFVLDKLTYAGNRENLKLIEGKYQFIKMDLADYDALDTLFSEHNFDYVVHFAAESHVDRSIANPQPFVEANITGTHNILRCLRKYGTPRYHHVSTDEVYGDLGEGSTDFFHEDTPLTPHCPYAATKACSDLMVMSYYHTYKLPITISRCTNNYGPYQFPEKAVPLFILTHLQGNKITLHGQGQHIRDWLFVRDHCIAIDLILHSDKHGEVYNIGGHNEHSTKDIARIILRELGMSDDEIEQRFVYITDREANDMRYAMAPDKIMKELGWQPTVPFEEGIKYTIQWYKNNQEWMYNIFHKEKDKYSSRFDMEKISQELGKVDGAVPNFLDKFTYSHEK
ncbi:MAG: dTDP-glucose 4,6-dehydratase [Patescibacteria group bacterium]|nr:dTDP-glucose 4,6-dehydratase [Patescibacteria group bacterium]